jgi:hypothetical protein
MLFVRENLSDLNYSLLESLRVHILVALFTERCTQIIFMGFEIIKLEIQTPVTCNTDTNEITIAAEGFHVFSSVSQGF